MERPAHILPPLSVQQTAWLEVLRRLRTAFPLSRYGEFTAGAMDAMARQWARDLRRVPVERVSDVYEATIIGVTFPPQMSDFGNAWDAIARDEAREEQGQEWQRHDEAVLRALPPATSRQPRFAQVFGQLQGSVVCNCPPKNGYPWPAELNEDATAWICARWPSCGFSLPVEDMLQARFNTREAIGAVNPESAAQSVVTKPKPRPKSGANPELALVAASCNIDLDACTPMQVAELRLFVRWWRERYELPLSRESFAEYFPRWQAEHAAQQHAAQQREKESYGNRQTNNE